MHAFKADADPPTLEYCVPEEVSPIAIHWPWAGYTMISRRNYRLAFARHFDYAFISVNVSDPPDNIAHA
jgi:hypothetical protein